MRSTRLFELAKAFRAECIAKEKELSAREKDLDELRGSARYDKVKAEIIAEREKSIQDARNKVAAETDALLSACLERAQRSRPIAAPTTDAINTLNLLELRLKQNENKAVGSFGNVGGTKLLSSQELNAAIPLMNGNPIALEALKNIAIRSGVILRMPATKEMTNSQAEEAVKTMARSLNSLYHLPKVGVRQEYAAQISGQAMNSNAIQAWRIDQDFSSESDFIQSMAFIGADAVADFTSIINQK